MLLCDGDLRKLIHLTAHPFEMWAQGVAITLVGGGESPKSGPNYLVFEFIFKGSRHSRKVDGVWIGTEVTFGIFNDRDRS